MLLVIDKKNSLLKYKANVISIYRDDQLRRKVPVKQLDQVIVYGNPMAETAVWRALAANNVSTVFLSSRGQAQQAIFLGNSLAAQLPVRLLQHKIHAQNKSLSMARYILTLKINSYECPLLTLKQLFSVDDKQDALISRFNENRSRSLARLNSLDSINELMGVEGQLAANWFNLLAHYLPKPLGFHSRNRRPPRDPVNALLSLGYTMIGSEIRQQIVAYGFDPSLGFLHQPAPAREALVLDIVEIFRAAIDHFVLQWLYKIDDQYRTYFYYSKSDGCRLSKEARPEFFNEWANYRYHWPRSHAECDDMSDWPQAPVSELIGGELMRLREQIAHFEEAEKVSCE